ncbi:thioredoxin [Enterococcus faecalis]|uniref:thioredoxin family protein n=1 Tax=Enterococcus faecalis TaxID=1351 RepID=UPI0019DA120E|nr:thioredoxin family protein [Enterococcus faecalis]EGO8395714.1 thioredoxin [Enterococcus faecalis]MCU9795331.1 thioredoxin family protein [Enterococcus faecalis]
MRNKSVIVSILIVSLLSFGCFKLIKTNEQSNGKLINSNIEEVLALQKTNTSFFVYLARNDCKKCQEVESFLERYDKKFSRNVYRIETRKEPRQEALQMFLQRYRIKSVPTFLIVQDGNVKKIERKTFFFEQTLKQFLPDF